MPSVIHSFDVSKEAAVPSRNIVLGLFNYCHNNNDHFVQKSEGLKHN